MAGQANPMNTGGPPGPQQGQPQVAVQPQAPPNSPQEIATAVAQLQAQFDILKEQNRQGDEYVRRLEQERAEEKKKHEEVERTVQENKWRGGAGHSFIDTRQIGKPFHFKGDDENWEEWSFKIKSYCGCLDKTMPEALSKAEVSAIAFDKNKYTPQQQEIATDLYYLLASVTASKANRIVRSIKNQDGFEAFRLLGKRFNPVTY